MAPICRMSSGLAVVPIRLLFWDAPAMRKRGRGRRREADVMLSRIFDVAAEKAVAGGRKPDYTAALDQRCSHRLAVRTSPSHGENWGSIPHGSATARSLRSLANRRFLTRPLVGVELAVVPKVIHSFAKGGVSCYFRRIPTALQAGSTGLAASPPAKDRPGISARHIRGSRQGGFRLFVGSDVAAAFALALLAPLPIPIRRHDAMRECIRAALKAIGIAARAVLDDGFGRAGAGAEGKGERGCCQDSHADRLGCGDGAFAAHPSACEQR